MKILFICESFNSKMSGGKAVRYLHQILSSHGHAVRITITSPFNKADTWIEGGDRFITPILRRMRYYERLYALANSTVVSEEFTRLIDEFNPDVVHFASFDQGKSANLYQYCHERKIRVVLQPWTMHFYCAQGYGYQKSYQCKRCITDGFSSAITQGCTSLRRSGNQLERASLRRTVIDSADVVLSSNNDLDDILQAYGILGHKIRRFPIPFDPSKIVPMVTTQGDYYIFYGQMDSHKGVDFIIEIFSALPDKKLKLYPAAHYAPQRPLPPNIEIVPGVGWDTGLRDAIADAKAVVVPSLWATTTEYSLYEAMTMRKPIVVFKVGAHKDILIHLENALVVEVGSREQFKAALDMLEANQQLYARLADAGAKLVAEINSPARLYAQLMDAYSAG